METKKCPGCKVVKARSEYYANKHSSDGFRSYCKTCDRARNKAECLSKKRARKNRHNAATKQKIMEYYSGGSVVCARCGFSDVRALSIDHINNDGAQHRRQVGSNNVYAWIVRNGFPDGFQVLCMNCQFIKEAEKRAYEGTS